MMKQFFLFLLLLSLQSWASCPVDNDGRCYPCNKKIQDYEQTCGEASFWIKIAKVDQNKPIEMETELVFLNKNAQVNIWLIEGDQCFTVSNKSREMSIPITNREDWNSFITKKPEVDVSSGCTPNSQLHLCEDPLPPVTCLNKEEFDSEGNKTCKQLYEEKSYAWEKVIYEIRNANGKNYCMKNDSFWVEVSPRPCLPCGFSPPAEAGSGNGTGGGGNGQGEGKVTVEDPSTHDGNTPGSPNQNPYSPKLDQIIGPIMRSLGISNV